MESAIRVLVVDDEEVILGVISRMLTHAGFVVAQAKSAREALALLAANDGFDAVVTDVVMPETDGHALGRLIAERHPALPIIYISAYPKDDVFRRGAPDDSAPFLPKPFAPEQLIALIERLISARGHRVS